MASTPRADVWAVRRSDGTRAALKIAKGTDKASEAGADAVLTTFSGKGMVRCLESDARAWLLEWVDGPVLGDLARQGKLVEADGHLVATCAALHRVGRRAPPGIPTVQETCTPLERFDTGQCPSPTDSPLFDAARDALSALTKDGSESRLLHGDFHHDNVGHSKRGWLAFDPKGVAGDIAYEPANSFGNPVGLEDTAREPERIEKLSEAFAEALGCPQWRILRWAVVHAALSMVWATLDEETNPFARLPLLENLLNAAD